MKNLTSARAWLIVALEMAAISAVVLGVQAGIGELQSGKSNMVAVILTCGSVFVGALVKGIISALASPQGEQVLQDLQADIAKPKTTNAYVPPPTIDYSQSKNPTDMPPRG